MKNTILPFLLGIFITISFAATTTNLLTVKPATPKSTVFIRARNVDEVKPYLRQGYIIKIVAKGDEWESCHVVLEKY
jgi:hypothetical protein